jgi:hypothetical protein
MMGDAVGVSGNGTGALMLHVRAAGTAAVESVQVRNGLQVLKRLRPYGRSDLGRRVKVVWSGAQVRGRDRMVSWDGGLRVKGNAILDAAPINFWNADHPLKVVGRRQLAWKSATTGGASGVLLTLEKPRSGLIEIETLEGRFECEIGAVGLDPRVWDCGGLRKRIEIYRLPDQGCPPEFSFALPLTDFGPGDHALYVRMTQEDGHMAWSSPIYLSGSSE